MTEKQASIIISEQNIINTYNKWQQEQSKLYLEYKKIKQENPELGHKRIATLLNQPHHKTRQWHEKNRIINFFEVAALKCSCCGKLGQHIDKSKNIQIIRSPEFFNISSIEEWEKFIDEELKFLIQNKEEVLLILPELENKWKESCKALRKLIKQTTNTQHQHL